MITVKWIGTFVREGSRDHVSKVTFDGDTLVDVQKQIQEFVECMEDSGWDLATNEVQKIEKVR